MCLQLFKGNADSYSVKASYFDQSVIARFIKFHTVEWSKHPSLRVEIVGCQGNTHSSCVNTLFNPLNAVHTSNNVEPTFDFVAKNGNNVEATGNKVASCFDIVAGVDRASVDTYNSSYQDISVATLHA